MRKPRVCPLKLQNAVQIGPKGVPAHFELERVPAIRFERGFVRDGFLPVVLLELKGKVDLPVSLETETPITSGCQPVKEDTQFVAASCFLHVDREVVVSQVVVAEHN